MFLGAVSKDKGIDDVLETFGVLIKWENINFG